MLKTKTQKLVTTGLMLALGILLLTITSHGIGFLYGKIFLPMHIPVLLYGIPGIIIQLILIPIIVSSVNKSSFKKYNAKEQAIKLINDSSKSCVIVKDNNIISAESPKGISHIIDLYESGILKDAFVADEVIGKAAAMIFSEGKIKSCYGYLMSKSALHWLNNHNIEATYNTLTDNIINRKGDDICPMEKTVLNIDDSREAIKLLKEKLISLR